MKTADTRITKSPVPASPVICSRAKVAYEWKLAVIRILQFSTLQRVSQLRQLDASFLPHCLGFNPRDFVVDEVTVKPPFYLIFPPFSLLTVSTSPTVSVEWVTVLPCIEEISSLNLVTVKGYPN